MAIIVNDTVDVVLANGQRLYDVTVTKLPTANAPWYWGFTLTDGSEVQVPSSVIAIWKKP